MKIRKKLAGVLLAGAASGIALIASAGFASANTPPSDPNCKISGYTTTINGAPAWFGSAKKGDTLAVTFTVPAGCSNQMALAAYRAPGPNFDSATANQQILDNSQSGTYSGTVTLTVTVPGSPAGDASQCSTQHNNSNGGGANGSGAYNSTCDGSASGNGKSTNNNSKKPCAGCVGNADNKNPPGQAPNGNDPNAGYECDRNQGVGQTNPAHTGCQSFQLDFAYGPVIQQLGTGGFYSTGLIAKLNG